MNRFFQVLGCVFIFSLSLKTAAFNDLQAFDLKIESIKQLENKEKKLAELNLLLTSLSLSSTQIFHVHNEISKTYLLNNELDTGLLSAETSAQYALDHQLQKEQAIANKMIGIFHYYRGENPEALNAYEKSLNIFNHLNFPLEQANILNNIALVHTTTGEVAKALSAIETAEPLYQVHGDEMDKVDIRYTLAGLYLRLKRYNQAIELLLEVIDKRLTMNDDNGLASAYADIGVAYKNARLLSDAEHYMNKAMDYYLGKKDYYQVASQYQNLSDLYSIKGDYQLSEHYALRAIEISRQVGHKKAEVGALYNLATALIQRGEIEEAHEKLRVSTQLGEDINYQPAIVNNKALLAIVFGVKQNTVESMKLFHEFLYEKHRLNSVNLNQQLAQFEAKQLSQQVRSLEQSEKLHALEQSQQEDKVKYVGLISVATVLLLFLFYRRYKDRQLKLALEAKVKQRTFELEIANSKLAELSLRDDSTSLHNRRSFDIDIISAWKNYIHKQRTFILLIASVDEFNLFNERYGHLAGDEVLRTVSKLIEENIREQDRAYRLGGADFAVIFEEQDVAVALAQFDLILAKLSERAIEHKGSAHHQLTLSAGVSRSDEGVQSIEQLIDKVDQRLYIAKKSGRNQIIGQSVKAHGINGL